MHMVKIYLTENHTVTVFNNLFTDPKCRRLLSFPWATCWDILNFIRRENIFKPGLSDGYRRGIMDPFGQKISKHIQDFLDVKIRDFDSFRNKLLTPRDNNMLALYTQKYPGFYFPI